VPLEEQIVEWSASRPTWQRAILRRVAMGEVLSAKDYGTLVESLLSSKEMAEVDFGLEQLPQSQAGDPPVKLISVEHPEHVNALTSDKPLTVEEKGLTIIYGDNGSGKSGYARLLKRVARSRSQEEILTDVFRDNALAKPTASLTIKVGDKEIALKWPESNQPELQRMLFFDDACGKAYVATESDFPYRSSAIFVMDGLIDACVAVRTIIDGKLVENSRLVNPLPIVDDQVRETEIGKLVTELSATSSLEALDALIVKAEKRPRTIAELKDEESRLLMADTSKERQRLIRQAAKIDSLSIHLEDLQKKLGGVEIEALQRERDDYESLNRASIIQTATFSKEPLSGVGTMIWKQLWESARRFSEHHAYPDKTFPAIDPTSRCMLCQQTLDADGISRLSRFDSFVKNDIQRRLREAALKWENRVRAVDAIRAMPDVIETNLKDLESDYVDLVQKSRACLHGYETAQATLLAELSGSAPLTRFDFKTSEACELLSTEATKAKTAAEGLRDAETIKARLASITVERKELELLQASKTQRDAIAREITRRKERDRLETVKNDATTGPITKKILELSESNITEVVRDTFTRETERMNLDRVTIAKTRGDKGTLLHQPKLVGARQTVTLPRVFSEGEQRALGLAAFFTEAQLDSSQSALILDDPVSSLDHVRRYSVATRLATFAESRQVVVFTHDVSFVLDLKKEANSRNIPVAERCVSRSRAGERKPGVCTLRHPWKAKDVTERLGELRNELARIKKESTNWDDARYETEVATWAGNLSETWERIVSQEVVGPIQAEGGLEVRPMMLKLLVHFSTTDEKEFQGSYSRVSLWAKRHDKSSMVNYVAPEITALEEEFKHVEDWFKRVKKYKD
jgi:energy-coupling factor transporter ATP-binding protein EcfA2